MYRFWVLFAIAVAWRSVGSAQAPQPAPDGCPPVRFSSAPAAALLPTPSSHRILAKQPDGSFTGFDLSNSAPYNLLHAIPHFDQQLRPCTPYETGFGYIGFAIGQPRGGGYLVAEGLEVAAYDANFNVTSQAQLNLPAGVPVSIQFADVNNDGNLDVLAFAEPDYMSQIVIFLGNGGASFQPPTVVPIPSGVYLFPASAANEFLVADINGDGKPDILGTAFDGSGVFALLGNGDGTFGAPFTIVPAASASTFAVADVNGDGIPDLVVSDASSTGPVVDIDIGLGNGKFAAPVQFAVAAQGPVAIGDLNGDGFPDIVTGDYTILFGDGKGNFPNRRDYLVVSYSGSTIITDFNGDGIPDIVSGIGNSSVIGGDTVVVVLGQGAGAFAAPPLSQVPGLPEGDTYIMSMLSGDFNNDGIPDIVVSCLLGNVSVLLGAGDGTFTTSFTSTNNQAWIPWSMVIADFNRDGNLDFAVASSYETSASLEVFLGNGKGGFGGPLEIASPTGAMSLATGDFNGDGKPDLAVLTSTQLAQPGLTDSVRIYLGNGDGSFTQGATYPAGPAATALVAGDFTGDGKLDLVVADYGTRAAGFQDGNLIVFAGHGDGTFAAQSPVALGSPSHLSPITLIAADFNRDGKLDLAFYFNVPSNLANNPGVAVMLGSGGGAFQAPVLYPDGAPVAAADINGDGILDLIAWGAGYRLGNGDGSFQALVPGFGSLALAPGPSGGLLADFNGDGKLDAALAELNGVAVDLNSSQLPPPVAIISAASLGPGTLAPGSIATAYGNFGSVSSVTVEDSTGDSEPATLLYGSSTQANFVLPSTLDAGPATVTIGSGSPAPIVLAPNTALTFAIDTAGLAAAYGTQVLSNGEIAIQPVFSIQNGLATPVPIDPTLGPTYLTFFITGQISPISPGSLPSGFTLIYDGPAPSFAGVQQINLFVDPSLGGSGYVRLSFGGTPVYIVLK